MSAQHTPTPWTTVAHSWEETSVIQTGPGKTVCALRIDGLVDEDTQDHYEAIMKADAAFIVRACNAHDDLVAALRDMTRIAKASGWSTNIPRIARAEAALAKAGAA